MRKKFRDVLNRKERVKKKPIDRTFYYSGTKLDNKIKEEEQLNMFLKDCIFEGDRYYKND